MKLEKEGGEEPQEMPLELEKVGFYHEIKIPEGYEILPAGKKIKRGHYGACLQCGVWHRIKSRKLGDALAGNVMSAELMIQLAMVGIPAIIRRKKKKS